MSKTTSSITPDLKSLKFLTAHQVSELTGVALQTLANHRHRQRGIPYCKFGTHGSIRYALADVLAFAESHRIDPEKGNAR